MTPTCRPVPLVVMLLVSACGVRQPEEERPRPVGADETGMVAGIQLVRDPAFTGGGKVLVASYRFAAEGVQAREAIAAFGATNVPRTDTAEFTFQLLDAQDRVLAQFGTLDPRKVVVEQQGLVLQPEAIYAARFPFNPNARAIRVLDNRGAEAARTDLVSVIREFCAPLSQDRDCEAALRGTQR
ncbi:MAG: hypothetical protein ACSLFK_08820 [Gemmatimonadaceae bacterium]